MKYSIAQWERERRRKDKREKRLALEQKNAKEVLNEEKRSKEKSKKKHKEERKNIQIRINYSKDLKDIRWFRKRKRILIRDNYTCQKCGAKKNLRVHHKKYISGRRPWQYNEKHLITLCNLCHEKEHLPEIKAKGGNKIMDKEFINRLKRKS